MTLISAGFTAAGCQFVAPVEGLARFWFLGLLIIFFDGWGIEMTLGVLDQGMGGII